MHVNVHEGAHKAYNSLTESQQRIIDEFLELNPREQLYGPHDIVNAYLCWNGIMGFTRDIINVVLNSHKE